MNSFTKLLTDNVKDRMSVIRFTRVLASLSGYSSAINYFYMASKYSNDRWLNILGGFRELALGLQLVGTYIVNNEWPWQTYLKAKKNGLHLTEIYRQAPFDHIAVLDTYSADGGVRFLALPVVYLGGLQRVSFREQMKIVGTSLLTGDAVTMAKSRVNLILTITDVFNLMFVVGGVANKANGYSTMNSDERVQFILESVGATSLFIYALGKSGATFTSVKALGEAGEAAALNVGILGPTVSSVFYRIYMVTQSANLGQRPWQVGAGDVRDSKVTRSSGTSRNHPHPMGRGPFA
jgi:hypothetical protein